MAGGSYKKVITLGLDYSEFQGGMKDCAEEMKKLDAEHKAMASSMDKTASKADKLAEANEYLSKKIELQNRKVELAKEKLNWEPKVMLDEGLDRTIEYYEKII